MTQKEMQHDLAASRLNCTDKSDTEPYTLADVYRINIKNNAQYFKFSLLK